MIKINRVCFFLYLTCIALIPLTTSAQTPADIEAAQRQADILQRQEQSRIQRDQEDARRQSDRVEGMDTKPLVPKITLPNPDSPCRNISVITITGGSQLSDVLRQKITDEFSSRCLNVGDIEGILTTITTYYIERGFITTRAYLPTQDLSQGKLEIIVIEGKVGKISIEDGNSRSVSIGNVFPGVAGGLLNLRDLEQGVDQINRLSSNNARLDIQPGENPGESTVLVHNQPQSRFHISASVDNQGQDSTGKVQTGVTGSVDDLLGFNDFLSMTHRESTPGDQSRQYAGSDSLSFNIPFGYTTLSLGSSRSQYANTISLPSGLSLVSSGNSDSNNLRLDRIVYRSQATRAMLATTLTTKSSRNYLDGQYLGVSSRNLTILDLDGNLSTNLAGGVISIDLGYAQGLNTMGALQDLDQLPDSAPRAQFGKFKYGFNSTLPFRAASQNFAFTSQLSGQTTNHVLYGSEQFQIGGLYSVRGFVNNVLSGDDGYYWRNEISMRQAVNIGSETVSGRFYVGYDTGEVRNIAPNIPQGQLSGMAIGISVNWRGGTWDFFNTRPLTLPGNMTKESSQTWFRVAYAL